LRVVRYFRQHHIGLIALFVALTGTAYAGTQVVGHPTKPQTLKAKKKKKAKPGPAGPAGPAGPQGLKGDTGQSGSPAASVNTGVIKTSGGGNYFGAPSGASGSITESDVQSLSPAGAPITARDLSVKLPFTLGPSGLTFSAAIRVDGADTALSCVIAVGSSGCQDTSHAVTIPPNSLISVRVSVVGSGTDTGDLWSFGWRAVP
jgi:hypothetical protein